MGTSRTGPLSLFEVMCAWVDQRRGAELLQLKGEGYDDPLTRYLVSQGPDRVKAGRFEQLVEELGAEIITLLFEGEFIAISYDPRLPLDSPAVTIPHDRWRVFVPDFLNSTARWGEITISGILVSRKDQAQSSPAGTAQAPVIGYVGSEPRLIITEAAADVTFDGVTVTLSFRAFTVLLVLAKAAQSGTGLVSNASFQKELWSNKISDRTVSDGVRLLRDQLRRSLGNSGDIPRLIQNRTRLGYLLNLRPDEVAIR
jgi:DNA-binding winged helix-turn-helix (wHTH) protein